MRVLYYFVILYSLYWSFCIVGILIVKSDFGKKLESLTWNSRIDTFQKIPFTYLLQFLTEKKFIPTVVFIALINFNNVIIQFLLGFILISPIMSIFSGVLVGGLLGQAEKRSLFLPYCILTMIFEFAAFSLGGALGMSIGYEWLLGDLDFLTAVSSNLETISIVIYLLPIIFLVMNSLIEASGPIFFDIKGIPPIKAIKNKQYKKFD